MTILIEIFLHNLLPIFLIVGTGALLGATLDIEVKSLSRTAFYVLTPCLLFSRLTRSELSGAEMGQIVLFATTATLLTGGAAWLVATALGWRGRRRRALTLPVLITNTGNFGLSAVLFAFGEAAQARAVVYFMISAVIATTLGITIAAGGTSLGQTARNVARVPTLYVLAGAMFFNAFERFRVPELFMRPVDLLGDAAVPTMLLVLGLQLVRGVSRMGANIKQIALAVALRLLAAPLLAYPVALVTGVEGSTFQACMLEASTPSGVTSTILALEYDLEPEAVAGTVLSSTLLSAFTLSILIAVIR